LRSTWCTRAELSDYLLIQRHPRRLLVTSMHFIGLDIHKKTISYCVKDVSGTVLSEGTIAATRAQLDDWVKTLPIPWTVAMEATMFTGWLPGDRNRGSIGMALLLFRVIDQRQFRAQARRQLSCFDKHRLKMFIPLLGDRHALDRLR